MKIGINYTYWEKDWVTNHFTYINKVANMGFDVCELAANGLLVMTDNELKRLKDYSVEKQIEYATCIGLSKEFNVASPYEATRVDGINQVKEVLDAMCAIGSKVLVGVSYGYWPVNYNNFFEKKTDRTASIASIREIASYAAEKNIKICLEVLNRYEQYLFNTASECIRYIEDAGMDNVYAHLDTFHMNIEENDSIPVTIRKAKGKIGHLHIGESNRILPYAGSRLPWADIAQALKDIEYPGYIVMEPLVLMGGEVAKDVKLWRDLSGGADNVGLDESCRESLEFIRSIF